MPFWYRTMCEELFCISILIYQDEDCNNKNNLLNIGESWFSKKDTVYKRSFSKVKIIKNSKRLASLRSNNTVLLVKILILVIQ